MATNKSTSPPRREHAERHHRTLHDQAITFAGLFLVPFAGLLTAWLIHAWAGGVDLTVWRWHWHSPGNLPALVVVSCLLTLAAAGLGVAAWHFAEHRKTPLRVSLAMSASAVGILFAVNAGIGPQWWWSGGFLLACGVIAVLWSMTRLNVTRQDPREPAQEPKEDTLEKKLGLEGYRYGKPKHHTLGGEIVRTDIDVTHAPGGTVRPVQDAVPAFESLADASGLGAPPGMSTARQGAGASTSHVSIIHKDILIDGVPYELPEVDSGGRRFRIDERPLTLGRFIDMEPATESVRSTQGVMGTTGAGKTHYARVKIAAISTRDWVAPVLYFDKVKGRQSAAPVIGALGACVLSNDAAPHKAGIVALERMLEYRANLLGELGYDEWRSGIRDHDGHPIPLVIGWFEESDVLIDVAPGKMVYLASKARSTGIVPVWSLQRADGGNMPTELRANVANWTVFGVQPGDDYSAGFALSDEVVKQGAKPYWGDTKPGYHFRTERETPANRWPVVRRVFDADRRTLWSVTAKFGPQMMPIDPGTAAATNGWLEQASAERDAIARTMTAEGMTMEDRPTVNLTADRTANLTANAGSAVDDDAAFDDRETVEREIEEDIEEMRTSGELPANPDPGDRKINVEDPVRSRTPDVSWADIGGKPAARDRDAALLALYRTLAVLSEDASLRDRKDPAVTVFQVDTIMKRYPYRSRPWFSGALTDIAMGEEDIPDEYGLTLTVDDDDDGRYRLHRVVARRQAPPPEADAQ
jgi:hypothetical protein